MNGFFFKRAAIAGLAAVALVGASLGMASAQQQASAPSGQVAPFDPSQAQQQPGPGQRPGPRDPNGERQPPTAEQIQQMQQERQQREQQYVNLLAQHLNMDPSTVQAAIDATQKDLQQARIGQIQQAVTDGKLTQEQANQMIQRIQSGDGGRGPGFGFGGPGGGPGRGPNGGQGNGGAGR